MNKVKIDIPSMQLPFGNYHASLINGTWHYDPIHKSENTVIKKEYPKYKDPVQFKIMEQYEEEAKNNYKKRLSVMVVEIAKFLRDL